MGMIVTDESFETSPTPSLLYFWVAWCGACHLLSQLVAKLEPEYPDLNFGIIYADENPKLSADIVIYPTVWFVSPTKNFKYIGLPEEHNLREFIEQAKRGRLPTI